MEKMDEDDSAFFKLFTCKERHGWASEVSGWDGGGVGRRTNILVGEEG